MFSNEAYSEVLTRLPNELNAIYNANLIKTALNNIYVYGYNTTSNHWFRNWQTSLMLAALLLENKENTIGFTHKKLSYSQNEINYYADNKTLPSQLTHPDPWASNLTEMPIINFIHITRGMDLFKYFDKECKDKLIEAKHLSLGLQTDKNHRIRVYTNLNKNTYTIVTSKYDWELLRKVIALIPNLLPSHFKVSSELATILKYFGKSEYENWINSLTEYYANTDILAAQLKQDLKDLLNSKKANLIKAKQLTISSTNSQINQYTSALEQYYRQLAQLQQELFIMQHLPDENSEDLYDYLTHHKYIKNLLATPPYLFFSIVSPITFYDIDALKAYYKNNNTCITQYQNVAAIFKAVFLENKYQLYMETPIHLNFKDLAYNIDLSYALNDTLYQPHLVAYKCWGTNKALITKSLANGDFIGAIEQMVAATKNINFLDNIVIEHLVGDLRNETDRPNSYFKSFFDPKTNTFYNTYDILQKIKESEPNETN